MILLALAPFAVLLGIGIAEAIDRWQYRDRKPKPEPIHDSSFWDAYGYRKGGSDMGAWTTGRIREPIRMEAPRFREIFGYDRKET